MRIDKIKRIVKRISQIYGVENYFVVTRINKNKIEIRTELPSYEGGLDLQRAVVKGEPEWICENIGGCIYVLYRPL